MAILSDDYAGLEQLVLETIHAADPGLFNEVALRLYQFQLGHNQAYANFCRHLGTGSVDDWKAIPAVPQVAFKQFAIRSFDSHLTVKTFRTSGTTGEGFGEHHFRSLRLYEQSILNAWQHFGLPRCSQIVLTPTAEQAPYSSLSYMMRTLANAALDQKYSIGAGGALNVESLCSQLQLACERQQPVMLLGTALAFLHLFEKLEAAGARFALPEGSAAMETGGYKGSQRTLEKKELYAFFTNRLGIAPDQIVNEYGMTELSSQFYAWGVDGIHAGPPWLHALVLDPETGLETEIGKTGLLKIVDLANLGSVISIQTQDLAVRHETGFKLLGRDPSALPRGCSRSADELMDYQSRISETTTL
jgi:hypothetical protein